MKKRKRRSAPNVILSTAIYAGLAALVRLAERRRNYRTEKLQKSIDEKWKEIRRRLKEDKGFNPRDFSIIQNAESNIRKMYLQMLWCSTKPFGNKEFKRVYSWRMGTVGPLNALLNYAGAHLRDLAVTRYPFPDPVYFQIRTFGRGRVKVLAKSVAESYPDDGSAKKVYWKAGYQGNSKHPRVLLTHPTLPGLDFVDMIRAHIIELCRQCFIYGVPRSEAHRYIRLLIHNLKPFLDWIYTDGETGRKDFFPDADKELRFVVLEIRALHGKRSGTIDSITRSMDDKSADASVGFLKRKAQEILNSSTDENLHAVCANIISRIDQGIIVDRDVTKLLNHAKTLSQKEGNDWHRVMLSSLHHPFSMRSVVYHGDSMLATPSNVLIVGELPVRGRTGKGQADIVYFIRRNVSGRTVWTPIMLLEMKTKTFFDFNLYSVRSKSKKDYLPASYVWKRGLVGKEWEEISTSHPDKKILRQLTAYEDGILREYRQLIRDDPSAPSSLWKGVVVIDTDQSYADVYDALKMLLESMAENIHEIRARVSEWTSLTLNSADSSTIPRVAVLLSPSKGPSNLVSMDAIPDCIDTEDPFAHRIRNDRTITLYVSVPSSTSHGEAAAWVSKNWHLLNHINECVEISDDKLNLIWLDLLGDFSSNYLLNARMGLRRMQKKSSISSKQYHLLQRLLDTIRFIDLSMFVKDFLFEGREFDLEALKTLLNIPAEKESIIIIDGWSDLTQMVPPYRSYLLRILECTFLDELPDSKTNLIWADAGAPHTLMNPMYQRRCIRPLPHDSARRTALDEIIYNLPLTPRVFGWQTPREVDMRVIVQDTPAEVKPWNATIRIPQLRDWARKFRGVLRRVRTVSPKEFRDAAKKISTMYGRQVSLSHVRANMESVSAARATKIQKDALTLVPSLQRPRNESISIRREAEELVPWIASSSPMYKARSLALNDRLTFKPNRPVPTPNKSDERYFPFKEATRGWAYGSIPDIDDYTDDWQGTIRRPPLFKSTMTHHIDSTEIRERELKRLFTATTFLRNQASRYSDLRICCDRIASICRIALLDCSNGDSLLKALKQIRRQILDNTTRRATWQLLEKTRNRIDEVLNSENHIALQRAVSENSELFTLYGNNLFLAVFAVADEVLHDTESPFVIELWSAIAEWQLYQMGFIPDSILEYQSRSRYDFQAIYQNLKWRGKQLTKIPQAEKPRFPERIGQIIQKDTGDGVKTWLVFQERGLRRFLAGYMNEMRLSAFLHGWYRCEIDPEELSDNAKDVLHGSDWYREPIVITTVDESDLLFRKSHEDDDWDLVGVMEYGKPPKDKRYPVRWFRFSEPPPEVTLFVQGYKPTKLSLDIDNSVNSLFQKAAAWSGRVREVICNLTLDPSQKLYRINILDGSKIIARKETPYTDEVVRFLRHPLRIGEYIEANDGTFLKWNVHEDIEYDDVRIIEEDGSTKWIHLSFLKPLILRSSFFPDSYLVPSTCQELLACNSGDDATMTFTVEERLKAMGVKKYLRVGLQGLLKGSAISNLESERMGIFDVALLAECRQIVDVGSGHIHDLDIDAKGLLDLRVAHLFDEYPRISNALVSLIESIEDSDSTDEHDQVVVVPSGPALKMVDVDLERRIRSRMIDAVAHFSNVEDESDIHEVRVFSFSSEIAKSQAIAHELIDSEVRKAMKSRMIEDDDIDELIEAVIACFEKEGFAVSYY
jgi:hypothetical protein